MTIDNHCLQDFLFVASIIIKDVVISADAIKEKNIGTYKVKTVSNHPNLLTTKYCGIAVIWDGMAANMLMTEKINNIINVTVLTGFPL